MVKVTQYVTSGELHRFQFYVKKHNLRWLYNPVQFDDKYLTELEGTVEAVNAFHRDMHSYNTLNEVLAKQLFDSKPFWKRWKITFMNWMNA